MPLLRTLLNATHYRTPLLRTLVPTLGLAYGIQAATAFPSIAAQSERFYDFSGSVTYLSCTALSLFLPVLRARSAGAAKPWMAGLNWRQLALSAAVSIWAVRLGSFLLARVTKDKGDSRFEKIKKSPISFFGAFMIQATWVSVCLLPVVAVNSLPAAAFGALGATDILGFLLYTGGLAFEAVADRQKSVWSEEKKAKKHEEDFLTSGLWGKSRHPNYFGEATLWTGIATVSAGVLASNTALLGLGVGPLATAGAILMAGISPAFVTTLLFKVSGIPLSEKKYDERYGDREDYKNWRRETPVFFPKLT